MKQTDQQFSHVPSTRRPYETPTVTELGSVASVTASIGKSRLKDGGSNKLKT